MCYLFNFLLLLTAGLTVCYFRLYMDLDRKTDVLTDTRTLCLIYIDILTVEYFYFVYSNVLYLVLVVILVSRPYM